MTSEEVGMWQGDAVGQAALSPAFVSVLTAARGGNLQALGALLQSFQPYLLAIARRGVPGNLRGKYDGADVVQETLLEAHRGFAGFDGSDSDDFRVWLCGILKHNLLDLIRRHRDASKRSIDRERSLDAGLESGEYSGDAIDPRPTPWSLFIARESVSDLREALLRLPADEQAVIVLRNFEFLSFQEVGQRLERSPEAARKLWSRAIARLQHMLETTRAADR
jgi:RNA polymerase sigma-70 factor (ECF subfamily)